VIGIEYMKGVCMEVANRGQIELSGVKRYSSLMADQVRFLISSIPSSDGMEGSNRVWQVKFIQDLRSFWSLIAIVSKGLMPMSLSVKSLLKLLGSLRNRFKDILYNHSILFLVLLRIHRLGFHNQ